MKGPILMLLSLVVVPSVSSISASADPPAHVKGKWLYLPYVKVKDDSGECVKREEGDTRPECVRVVGGNTFMETYEDGWWEGDFEGTSEDHGTVMILRSGRWFFWARILYEGAVNGKEGTLEMFVAGWRPDASAEWQGRLVILSGTGDLEDLRGQGTWWGPGWLGDPEVPGIIYYDGTIRFDD